MGLPKRRLKMGIDFQLIDDLRVDDKAIDLKEFEL